MKRQRPSTFEELLEQTSTQWEYTPHGLRLTVSQEPLLSSHDRLEFRLSPAVAAKFKPRPRERLVARVSGRRLIVERAKAPVRKRAHRG